MRSPAPRFVRACIAACTVLCTALGALLLPAASAQAATRPAPESASVLYQRECGACHLAYPARLLPAASWERIMGGLAQHFGADASLDATSAAGIAKYLRESAGWWRLEDPRPGPPADRITRSAWFTGEHAEVPAWAWKSAKVKSASNCAACHSGAEQGRFHASEAYDD